MASKNLVIVGGGFAGVYTANYLHRRLPAGWRIVLFSQENHFIFTPLLGDVVGSSINPMHVVWPIRQMARQRRLPHRGRHRHRPRRPQVDYLTAAGRPATQAYDHLVLACGSVVNLDIMPGMAAHGWPLKTMGDALVLRNHLIAQMEKAEVETEPRGAAAAALGRRGRRRLQRRRGGRRDRRPAASQLPLLQERQAGRRPGDAAGRPRPHPARAARDAVGVRPQEDDAEAASTSALKTVAQAVTEHAILLKDGAAIDAGTVVCTIGTTTQPAASRAWACRWTQAASRTGPDMQRRGARQRLGAGRLRRRAQRLRRQAVRPDRPGRGAAGARSWPTTSPAPSRARPTRPFCFKPLGMLASIGNHKAVGLVFGLKVSGFLAWFLWRGIYLGKMPTLARKIQIAFDWAWQLFFPRDIVQLTPGQTERFGRAHFEAGQFVFHKGDPGDRFYIIEQGRAGVYLDETGPPVAMLRDGRLTSARGRSCVGHALGVGQGGGAARRARRGQGILRPDDRATWMLLRGALEQLGPRQRIGRRSCWKRPRTIRC